MGVSLQTRISTAVVLFLLACASVIHGMSIDQLIMKAAPKSSALDTFHMSPSGEVMMMVELDIQMDIKQYMQLKENKQVSRNKRKAIRSEDYRWENCYVYYEIDQNYFDTEEVSTIKAAMDEWEKYTCLSFKKATLSTKDKVVFVQGSGGCYSRLGRVGGTQEIGLSRGCVHKGVVVHEIGHAIGWIHEQARPDRDRYIRVNFNRIPAAWHPQFDKFSARLINDYGVKYDYLSIMHYSGNAVAQRSIETLDPDFQSKIGQRGGLSFRDVMLANLMYGCAKMLCGGQSTSCSHHGDDAFLFKREGEESCQCFCPGTTEKEIMIPCRNPVSTTTPSLTTPTPTTTPSTTADPEPMECVDLRDDCAALVEAGECKMDMERMMMFCKKSCNFCEKEGMCMDYDPTCPLLALGNFCDRPGFESLMEMKCKKSCQFCTPVDPCQMQLEMGLSDVTSASGSFHSSTVLGSLVVLAWALHCLSPL